MEWNQPVKYLLIGIFPQQFMGVIYGLVPFHLTLREFKQTKERFKHLGQFAEEHETETIASFFAEK